MKKYICAKCHTVTVLPHHHDNESENLVAENDDSMLLTANRETAAKRKKLGLDGLVGGLDHVIINTEPEHHLAAVEELLATTGLDLAYAFKDEHGSVCVLKTEQSADFLITSNKRATNPFLPFNQAPKARHLPNTRLETLVFSTPDIHRYVAIQRERGISFLTPDIIERPDYLFIQTIPSSLTGNSTGFIQWTGQKGKYRTSSSSDLSMPLVKPESRHIREVKYLDHVATRVEASHRDQAIIEFMELTNYNFDFAIYIRNLNSITSVTRLTKTDFALVFTSGIARDIRQEYIGPTETYVRNYGPRVHHMAFYTQDIDYAFDNFKRDGMQFLSELVGSPGEGLKQAFTTGSAKTLLVNEYIHRFGDFDGFFTRSNVEMLTRATEKQ